MASIGRLYGRSKLSYSSLIPLRGQEAGAALADDFFDTSPETILVVNPASSALTGYWPNTFTGAPNVGVASASPGTSLNNDQTAGATGWSNPGIGTGLNAFASSTFDGVNVGQVADDTTSTMLGSAGWSYAVVAKTSALGVRTTSYANPPLFSDNASVVGVTVSDGGVSAFQFDAGAADVETPLIPFPNDTWALIQAKWDGVFLWCRVNNGPWSWIPTTTFFARGTDIWLGRTGYAALNGEKLVEMFAKYAWTPAQADGFGVWAEALYDTEFGFTFPGTVAWSGAWEGSFTGAPWPARASIGQSAVNGPLVSGGFVPSVGAAANGRSSADFSGSTKLLNTNDVTVFVGQNSAAFSISGVVAIDTAAARTVGGGNADAAIVSDDTNGHFYVTATTSGITVGYFDVGSVYREINKACAADGLPHTFHAWLFGGTLNLTVDGVAATPVTGCGNTRNAAIGGLQVGQNWDQTKHFDGRVWSLRIAPVDVGPTVRTNLEAYYRARYFSTSTSTVVLRGLRAIARLGKAAISGLNTLFLRGARVEASVGIATVTTAATVSLVGVSSDARAGRATFLSVNTVVLSGLRSDARSGRVTFSPGVATMALAGVDGRASLGRATFAAGPVSISLAGLSADARAGRATFGSLYTVSLAGLSAKGRASSGLLSTSYTVSLGGVPGRARVGIATVAPGSVSLALVGGRARAAGSSGSLATFATMAPAGVPVDARVGRASFQSSNLVQLAGVRGRTATGSATVVPGAVAAALSGVASRARVGLVVVAAGGGAPSVLTLSGLRSDAIAGLLAVSSTATIAPRGASADARVGLGVLTSAVTISLRGLRSRAVVGRAVTTSVATIALVGPSADARAGRISAASFYTLAPAGVPSDARVGRAQFTTLTAIALSGVRSEGIPGRLAVLPGVVTLTLKGAASDAHVGTAVVFNINGFVIALSGVRAIGRVGQLKAPTPSVATFHTRVRPLVVFKTTMRAATEFVSRVAASTKALTPSPRAATSFVSRVVAQTTFHTRVDPMILYVGAVADIFTELEVNDEGTDPSGLSIEVTPPPMADGTPRPPVTYVFGVATNLTKLSGTVSSFKASVDCTYAGKWTYKWISPGPIAKGVDRGYFDVEP